MPPDGRPRREEESMTGNDRPVNIAIDGPAGAGKSTIARRVAARRSYVYVDTGAMFRAMGLYMGRAGIDVSDEAAVSAACGRPDITIEYRDGEQVVLLDGENVNGLIRTQEVGELASRVSVHPAVRTRMAELQRELARTRSVVMDGRDIGTVILPDAQVKIYLTASAEVRARRRFLELEAKGQSPDLSAIEAEIRERDHRDMTRPVAPLRQAEDAVLVDTSDMTIDEVAARIMEICAEKLGE